MGEESLEICRHSSDINSFKVCGISVEKDGTEDGLVHCTNLEGWQLTPYQTSRPRQPRSFLANNTASKIRYACTTESWGQSQSLFVVHMS